MKPKPTPRQKPRILRLEPETAVAIDDMMARVEAQSRGWLWMGAQGKNRALQSIIRAACEAVVNFDASEHEAGRVGIWNDARTVCMFAWPLAFDARPESRDETAVRVMLANAGNGEPITRGAE